jgi:cell division protein FtsQ
MLGRPRGRPGSGESTPDAGAADAATAGAPQAGDLAGGAVWFGPAPGGASADGQAAEAGGGTATATDDSVRPQGSAAGQTAPAGRAGRKRGRRRPRDPWRVAFFAVLGLAVLAGGAWALLDSSLLVVRHEVVTGNGSVPSAEILSAAGIRRGTPMAQVNAGAAAHRIEQINQVLSATVSRSWPGTIVISVRERTPVFAVRAGGRFGLVDAFGVTVRSVRHRPAGMPVLAPPSGQLRGSPAIRVAALVLRALPARLRAMVTSVAAPSGQDIRLHLRGGVTVVWGTSGQARAKAAEVAVLLRSGAHYLDVSDPASAVTQR